MTHIQVTNGHNGLANLGNTCYLNTALQCIMHQVDFVHFLLERKYKQQDNPHTLRIIDELSNLAQTYWSSTSSLVNPQRFVHIARNMFKQHMEVLMQNDMEEFLILLLTKMCEEIGETWEKPKIMLTGKDPKRHLVASMENSWTDSHKKEYSKLIDLVYGQTITQVKCDACSYMTHAHEVFTTIPISMPTTNAITLEELIDENKQRESLQCWKCDKCAATSDAKRSAKFWRFPQVLIIVLKRFASGFTKNNAPVTIPEHLDLDKHSIYETCKFDLVSLGCHKGDMHGGHYYAICKHPDGSYYLYDDDHVQKVDNPTSRPHQDFYVAVYEKS